MEKYIDILSKMIYHIHIKFSYCKRGENGKSEDTTNAVQKYLRSNEKRVIRKGKGR